MKTTVVINFDVEGFHFYKNAPEQVQFLQHPHRHLFTVKVGYRVEDLNREREIFIETDKIKEYLGEAYGIPCRFNQMSCEMIAKEILEYAQKDDAIWCSVIEDGRGGGNSKIMKIHFAGSDDPVWDEWIQPVGIKYRLNSYYYLRKKPFSKFKLLMNYNHIIIDSGLFTMMFGSKKKTVINETLIEKWMKDYIKFINTNNFNNTDFVECDVQKVISADYAWDLRQRMKAQINKGGVINVYHLEDGNPDKLINYSDYIAVSLPELRIHLSDKERYQLTKYIAVKATLKGKKVHLLGCTEKKYITDFSFCYSADSTSWLSPLRYGKIKTKTLNINYNTIKKELSYNASMLAVLYQEDYRLQSNSQL